MVIWIKTGGDFIYRKIKASGGSLYVRSGSVDALRTPRQERRGTLEKMETVAFAGGCLFFS